MYEQFYGFEERPFSITPDPRFVYLSPRHQDALAHLLYGVGRGGSGGFVQLTGEVGTGKTTLCRLMLEQVPENARIALVLNPMLEPRELLRAICRDLEIEVDSSDGHEALGQKLNERLLEIHAAGERAVLIIDEAQNMSRETLEQVRLLTNLETATDKLLQIILLGQPELRELLSRPSLRQLAQRITARYHLAPLQKQETVEYVRHRIRIAGAQRCPFSAAALKTLHHVSGGVPRLINIIADRALMAGYAREADRITPAMVRRAAAEVSLGESDGGRRALTATLAVAAVLVVLAISGSVIWSLNRVPEEPPDSVQPVWRQMLEQSARESPWRELATLFPESSAAQVERACNEGLADGLACHRLRGNWAFLRQLDQPVLLRLTRPREGRVVVLEIEGADALVRAAGQDFRVPLRQLDERWLGDFDVLWRDSGEILQQGDRGEPVEHLQRLAVHDVEQPWAGALDGDYSADFARWLRQFQRRHGLAVDGVAGPVTRLVLERVNSTEPGAIDQTD